MAAADPGGQSAIIFGAGPGLGLGLARCFAQAGMRVALAARKPEHLSQHVAPLQRAGAGVQVLACDVAVEADVIRTFDAMGTPPDLVVFNAGAFMPGRVKDIRTADFEQAWRTGCLGGFLVGREAARRMPARGTGTILFTGATASLRGSAGFANLAVGKFGLRALAQSLARDLGPEGIHVAHVIIDGMILSDRHPASAGRPEDALLHPDDIARNYLDLHLQPRSAWTQELDLRPWTEKF